MQHMDEGLLQAWLDGARGGLADAERARIEGHVAECPTCAARLEALRATSERTAELLAMADDMDDEIPAFDAVVRRAQELSGQAKGPGSARPGVRPLWGRRTAWAASIAIALGAGWLANEWNAGTPEAVLAPVQVTEAPAAPSAPGGSEADGAALPESLERQEEDRVAAASPTPSTPVEGEVSAEASAVPAVLADAGVGLPDSAAELATTQARAAMAEVAENALTADRMAAGAAEATRAGSPAQLDTGRLSPPPVEPDPVVRLTGATPAPPRSRTIRGRVVDAATGAPIPAVQVSVAGAEAGSLTNADGAFSLRWEPGLDSIARFEVVGYRSRELILERTREDTVMGDVGLTRTAVALDEVVVSGATVPLALGDPRWQAASRAVAEERVSFPVGIVGALPVTAVHVGIFEGVSVVRVAQELEDGRPVVLIQSVEPVAFSSDEPGPSVAGTRTDGIYLTLWADLPQDSLRALLDRVGAR